LSESELLAICHGPHNTPERERGLTIRQVNRHLYAQSTAPEHDDDASSFLSVPSIGYGNSSGRKATQRASAYKVLSDFDGDVSRPSSPSSVVSQGHRKGKLREFFGQRPPSELISNHLPEYFPFTEKKVLARTARNSMMMRPKRLSVMSTASWSSTNARPSRFSVSTTASGISGRRSIESNRAASERTLVAGPSSPSPPPVPAITAVQTPEKPPRAAMETEAPPRVSLSTDDGRRIDLNTSPSASSSSHLLPPVRFPTESLSDSMQSLTRSQQQGISSTDNSIGTGAAANANATRRMSYMKELRSKKDRSDTASVITMDQVTAEVQSRRESMALERLTDNDSWSLVGGAANAEDEAATAEVAPAPIDATDEFDEEEDSDALEDEDEEEYEEDEDDDDDDDDATDEVEVVDEEGKVHKARSECSVFDRNILPEANHEKKTDAKWIKGALIGKGSFGEVYLGLDAATGFLMAVKQVKLPSGSSLNDRRTKEMVIALEREIELLNTLKHENIVQYFCVFNLPFFYYK
jgi:mitogen-activated protein kinase kinase kinase